MSNPPEVRRAILTHQDATRQVRESVERFARARWLAMEDYRDADVDRMVADVVPVSLGGQLRIAALTDNYMASLLTASGYPTPASGIPAEEVTGEALRGVPPEEVYRRSGVTVWAALSDGHDLQMATRMGLDRLMKTVAMDLQLAKTHAARWFGSRNSNVVGYRRVLTGAENCGLCVLASTQRYHKGELLPIHNGCDCEVAAITGKVDPGQVIDQERLDALHDLALERTGDYDPTGKKDVDYRKIRVREHGEYGPVLTWADQHFTGPRDI